MKGKFLLPLLFIAVIAACAWLMACEEEEDDSDDYMFEYYYAIPSEESLRLELPGADYENDDYGYKAVGDHAKFYTETVQHTRNVNAHILGMLSIIDEITSYPYTSHSGGTYTWGPWQDTGLDQAQARFILDHTGGGTFDYLFQWRPKDSNSDADWTTVWEGRVEASADTARRGIGHFSIDFDAASAIDWTVEERGQIVTDYDTVSDGREINLEFVNFIGDDAEDDTQPLNAEYFYHNRADNSGYFVYEWYLDIFAEDASDNQNEHAWFNTRWQTDGAGRTDVVIGEGDIADFEPIPGVGVESFNSAECWGSDYLRTYFAEGAVGDNGQDYTNPDDVEGSESDCVFEEELPDAK